MDIISRSFDLTVEETPLLSIQYFGEVFLEMNDLYLPLEAIIIVQWLLFLILSACVLLYPCFLCRLGC